MIGTHLQAAANTLEVIVQSGDWKRDEKLELAAIRLAEALNAADTLPELQAAYQATVDAYAAYIHASEEVQR